MLLPRLKDFHNILLRNPKVSGELMVSSLTYCLSLCLSVCLSAVLCILICFIQMSAQTSTIGTLNPPLGNTRLQTIHLITAIIEANDSKINQELLKLNTLSVLLVCTKVLRIVNSLYCFVGIIFSIPME